MNAQEKVEAAGIQLIHTEPFFAAVLMQMRKQASKKTQIAASTIINGQMYMYYNPDDFDKRPVEEVRGILKHEVLHLILEHVFRREGRDPFEWNIATDFAVNSFIKDLPKDGLKAEDFKLPTKNSAEWYHQHLPDEFKKANRAQITFNEDGTITVEGPEGSGPNGEGRSKKTFRLLHDMDEFDTCNERCKEDPALAEAVVRGALETALEKCQGNVPGELQEYIDALLKKPTISWKQLLRQYFATSVRAGFKASWKRENRRFGPSVKGKMRERVMNVMVAVDTSGSMGAEEFEEAITEIHHLCQLHKGDKTVIEIDMTVQREYKMKKGLKVDFKGRGGTSFVPLFDYINEKAKKPDLLIYITDLYGDFPEYRPSYPVIWLRPSSSHADEIPWGRLVPIRN
jgi:predicted metal-dependent peptidase